MKRLLSIFLFIVSWQLVVGQATTFSKVFADTGIASGGINITNENDTIYFSFYTQDTTGGFIQYLDFIKVSPDGASTTWQKVKVNGYTYSTHQASLKVTSRGRLLCGGDSGPYPGVGSGTYYNINSVTFDSVSIQYYQNPGKGADFFGAAELSDANYLFSGREGDTNSSYYSAWMVKTDTTGNIIWQKDMSSDVLNWASYTSPFNGGFYQFWETTNRNITYANGGDSAIFVDRYDNNGDLQWRDTFGVLNHDNVSGPFISTHDDGAALFLNALDTADPTQGTMFMPDVLYRLDSAGSILWERYFPALPYFFYFSGMAESKSGSLILCGSADSGYISLDSQGIVYPAIVKLDKDGNLIFFQYYHSPGELLNDITETSDGGYACIGNGFENIGGIYYQKAWLLKVDSNGCLNGDCPTIETGIKDIPALASFFVFPNPVSSQFTVALAGPNDLERYSDLHFMLYDLTGREVMNETLKQQTTILQRGDISQGMYVWQIGDGNSTLSKGKLVFK